MSLKDKDLFKYIGLGWLILTDLLIFIFLGYYIGNKYNLSSIGILFGAFIAFLSIGLYLYKVLKELQDKDENS